jgi:hypothetical protein
MASVAYSSLTGHVHNAMKPSVLGSSLFFSGVMLPNVKPATGISIALLNIQLELA